MSTFEDLVLQQHTLGLYCVACERWGDADLDRLIRAGYGAREITRTRFRCRDCGEVVEKQLRPPVPQAGAAEAYI